MNDKQLPDHLKSGAKVRTARQWRQKKRREWRAVTKALDIYMMGCAYTTDGAYRAFDEIRDKAKLVEQELRGDWIAWGFKHNRSGDPLKR